MEVWMGTHPTKRLFFRRLAVEKGKNYGADEITANLFIFRIHIEIRYRIW